VKLAGVVVRGFGCGIDAGVRLLGNAPIGATWHEDALRKRCEDARLPLGCMYEDALPPDLAHLAGAPKETPDFSNSEKPVTPTESITESPIIWGGWNEPIMPPVYLLEGLIPEGKVCTFFAEGGSVKSWSAFALAIAVATGEPWLGQVPVQRGKALILDFEDGRYEFQRRMRLLRGGLEDLPQLGYWYCPPYLDKLDLWRLLAPLGLKLLVIDSLSAGMPNAADENSKEFSEAVKIAGRFTEVGCTVVIIHHANKTGGMRGHGSVRDQSDVVFKFDPVSETDSVKRMRMVCDKPGPQKRPKPVNVELSDAGLKTFEDEANSVGRNANTSEDIQAAILLALETPRLTQDKVREAVGKDRTKVCTELAALIKAKKVIEIEGVGYCLDTPAARTERVLQNVRGFDGRESAAALAKRSYVSTRFVEDMILRRALVPRVSGNLQSGFIQP
jgi:hypothetical protein